MKLLIVFLLPSVFLINCKQNTQNVDQDKKLSLTIQYADKVFKSDERIYEGDTIYAEMSFRYPIFSGSDEQVVDRINRYIFSLTQDASFGEDTTRKTSIEPLSEIAKRFFLEAKESEIEGYPYTSAWSYELETDTLFVDIPSKRLTLIHNYYTYTGGAHPNYYIELSNIDLNTGDTLSTQSLFRNDKLLIEAAKKRFTENEKLVLRENGYDFQMSDYWFENDKFHLPHAIGYTREGIRCIYSPYEVSSYARGSIDFIVPYSDVPHLMPTTK